MISIKLPDGYPLGYIKQTFRENLKHMKSGSLLGVKESSDFDIPIVMPIYKDILLILCWKYVYP